MAKILVTPRSLTKGGDPSLQLLRNADHTLIFCRPGEMPSEDELLRLLPGCSGYLAGVEKVPRKVLEAASGLRVISRNGAGIDNVDLEAARELGIAVLPAPGANARGVAELTIGLILALVRSIPFSDGALKDDQWKRRKGIEVLGRTLGLVGCGDIGKQVAMMATGLGMMVEAFRRHPDESFHPVGFQWASLEDILSDAEVLSLHCPSSGRPVIDLEVIDKLRKGTFLVNTARADLVDEDAVLSALESGQLAGYATDVYLHEPPTDTRLVKHERVIATPHIGGFTEESVTRATEYAVRNILDTLEK